MHPYCDSIAEYKLSLAILGMLRAQGFAIKTCMTIPTEPSAAPHPFWCAYKGNNKLVLSWPVSDSQVEGMINEPCLLTAQSHLRSFVRQGYSCIIPVSSELGLIQRGLPNNPGQHNPHWLMILWTPSDLCFFEAKSWGTGLTIDTNKLFKTFAVNTHKDELMACPANRRPESKKNLQRFFMSNLATNNSKGLQLPPNPLDFNKSEYFCLVRLSQFLKAFTDDHPYPIDIAKKNNFLESITFDSLMHQFETFFIIGKQIDTIYPHVLDAIYSNCDKNFHQCVTEACELLRHYNKTFFIITTLDPFANLYESIVDNIEPETHLSLAPITS